MMSLSLKNWTYFNEYTNRLVLTSIIAQRVVYLTCLKERSMRMC